jgi:uncharacterized membrane protein HdeD (DUF308 family)
MQQLDKLTRGVLFASFFYNLFGVLVFFPTITLGRRLVGVPDAHAFYLCLVTIWIGSFGILYLWLAKTARPERGFLIIAAIGKFGFWTLTFAFWLAGEFPIVTPIVALGDFIGAAVFTRWLLRTRG